jgi:hypothetical protein
MRPLKLLSMLLVFGAMTASAVADSGSNVHNRFGKGPTTIGLTPPGFSTSGGTAYSRQYVQPAPAVATAPATDDRRTFSAEPSKTDCTAPAAATASATDGRRAFSAEPSTVQRSAPAVGVMSTSRGSAPEFNRFGKGPVSIGLTPPGFSR